MSRIKLLTIDQASLCLDVTTDIMLEAARLNELPYEQSDGGLYFTLEALLWWQEICDDCADGGDVTPGETQMDPSARIEAMTKPWTLLRIVDCYCRMNGRKEVDHRNVAEWAERHGYTMPTTDPVQVLTEQISDAARWEVWADPSVGSKYRRNHSTASIQGGRRLWFDIFGAPRPLMAKWARNKRAQMVRESEECAAAVDHWNRSNPDEKPIPAPFFVTRDAG